MPKVQIFSQVELDTDELLRGVARLDEDELERFAQRVLAIRAQRHNASLPEAEVDLLQQIYATVSPEARQRYDYLHERMLGDVLTSNEQTELMKLSDQIEEADAQRLQYLLTLSQIRGISVDELMDELKLPRRIYA